MTPHGDALLSCLNLHRQGRLAEAERCYRQTIGRQPDHAEAFLLLGRLLEEMGPPAGALPYLRQAVALNPNNAAAWHTLGELLLRMNQAEEGERSLRQALALRPDYPECLNNLANLLADRGAFGEAETLLRQALTLAPDHAGIHHHLGLLLLLLGRWEEGWREHEWRLRTPKGQALPFTTAPFWQGETAPGQTLLVHAEQGLGDTVQFLRFLPLVAARVGRVAVRVQEPLMCLADAFAPGPFTLHPLDAPPPPHDLQTCLMSLPGLLDIVPDSLPPALGLTPDPARAARWRQVLARVPRPRVGLVWAGNPAHVRDGERSLNLAELAPLAEVAGITWLSLQKGAVAVQAAHPPSGLALLDLSPHLATLAETVALMAELDLVVSVDTLVAHLAGSMGVPVWTLHRHVPDWRWGVAGDRTPWYPSMRLVRQPRPGAWREAVMALARALAPAPVS